MMRNSEGEVSRHLQRRDQKITRDVHGMNVYAKHMYTWGLSYAEKELKSSGNYSKYAEAEQAYNEKQK